MHKVVFALALAGGLMTAPLSQFVSSAAAQQQASIEKNAKTTKEPSADQLATRERQKKFGAEWKEMKASNKIEKGTTWPKFWSACNNRLKSAAN
jgi:lipopolysaccharide export LptBFGC system permease protein LptF